MTYPLTIHARFNSDAARKEFWNNHVAPFAGPDKPVFSYSTDDESRCRDTETALRTALEQSRKGWLHVVEFGLVPFQYEAHANKLAEEARIALEGGEA